MTEIILKDVVKRIYKKKYHLIIITVFFSIIGYLISLDKDDAFLSTTLLIPQNNTENKSSIGNSFAGLTGINFNLNNTSNNIPMAIYPKIIETFDFKNEILKTKLYIEKIDSTILFSDYLILKKNKDIINNKQNNKVVLDSNIIIPSQLNVSNIESINDYLNIEINNKEGILKLSSSFEEPIASAQLLNSFIINLEKTITNLNLRKLNNELKYLDTLLLTKHKEYINIQNIFAKFQDENRAISSKKNEVEFLNLKNEYDLIFSIYTEIKKKHENKKLEINENKIIFSRIDKIKVVNKNEFNRINYTLRYTIISLVLSLFFLVFYPYIIKIILSIK